MNSKIYFIASKQISIQKPLSEEWMTEPVICNEQMAHACDPDFRAFFKPMEMRRLGNLAKRAIATSISCINEVNIKPDAIITGTGYGCIENTEIILQSIENEGELAMKPTHFMQSTHNTISSLIALQTGNHGYNSTYSNRCMSFDSALFDGFTQLKLGYISTVLIGSHDEITESCFTLLEKVGFLGCNITVPSCDSAVSCMLQLCEEVPENAYAELVDIRFINIDWDTIGHELDKFLADNDVSVADISAVMTGINGNRGNDFIYNKLVFTYLNGVHHIYYKHIFGESFSSSGLGVNAAICCMRNNNTPDFLNYDNESAVSGCLKYILVINQNFGKDLSLILIRKA